MSRTTAVREDISDQTNRPSLLRRYIFNRLRRPLSNRLTTHAANFTVVTAATAAVVLWMMGYFSGWSRYLTSATEITEHNCMIVNLDRANDCSNYAFIMAAAPDVAYLFAWLAVFCALAYLLSTMYYPSRDGRWASFVWHFGILPDGGLRKQILRRRSRVALITALTLFTGALLSLYTINGPWLTRG